MDTVWEVIRTPSIEAAQYLDDRRGYIILLFSIVFIPYFVFGLTVKQLDSEKAPKLDGRLGLVIRWYKTGSAAAMYLIAFIGFLPMVIGLLIVGIDFLLLNPA